MTEKRIKIAITVASVIFVGMILGFVLYNNTNKDVAKSIDEETDISNSDKYIRYKGIIIEIDDTKKKYTVRNYDNTNQIEIEYVEGCEIKNRYGKDIYYDKLKVGDVVVVGYDKKISNLKYIHIDESLLYYTDLKKYGLNTDTYYIELDDKKFRLNKETFVCYDDKEHTIYDINENDVLSLYIKDKEIVSVVIQKGHGKVTLTNADSFIGKSIIVNDDKSYEIEKGLELIVPEGKNTFTIKTEKLTGSINLNIISGYDRVIDVNKITFEKKKEGKVQFYIEPEGARLYINGKSYSYQEQIPLDYGTYTYVVESAGYSSSSSKFTLESDLLTLSVHLYEKKETVSPSPSATATNDSTTASASASSSATTSN